MNAATDTLIRWHSAHRESRLHDDWMGVLGDLLGTTTPTTVVLDVADGKVVYATNRSDLHVGQPYVDDHCSHVQPLDYGGQTMGAVHIGGPADSEVLETLASLAPHFAVALVNVQMLEELRRTVSLKTAQLKTLTSAGMMLGQLDQEQLLVEILDSSLRALSGTLGAVVMVDDAGHCTLAADFGLPLDVIVDVVDTDGQKLIHAVLESGLPRLPVTPSHNPIDLLCVLPLAVHGDVLGAVCILANDVPSDEQRAAAEMLCRLGGLALRNARVHELRLAEETLRTELRTAGNIQRSLLPTVPPVVRGIDLAGHAHPADDCGGDWYDFIVRPDGNLLIVLGDVVGHGVASAILATTARATLRTLAGTDYTLQSLIVRLNDSLEAQMGDDRFITVFIGEVDVHTGQLRYSSAGHEPALLRRDGVDTSLAPTGIPLGMFAGMTFGVNEVALKTGDHLLLVTDGVTEMHAPDCELYGEERLSAVCAPSGAQNWIDAVLSDVELFRNHAKRRDDVTLVAMSITSEWEHA